MNIWKASRNMLSNMVVFAGRKL